MHTLNEINTFVNNYKVNKDTDSLEQLLKIFDPFLQKWVNIVKYGTVNILDGDTAKFISLFGCNCLSDFKDRVVRNFYHMTEEDMYGELVILFIYTIEKYIFNGSVFFPGYLSNSFMYRLYRWVSSTIKRDINIGVLDYYNDNVYTDDVHKIIFNCLTPREQNIITSIYIDRIDKEEIAKIHNISIGRLNGIIANAKKKIMREVKMYNDID